MSPSLPVARGRKLGWWHLDTCVRVPSELTSYREEHAFPKPSDHPSGRVAVTLGGQSRSGRDGDVADGEGGQGRGEGDYSLLTAVLHIPLSLRGILPRGPKHPLCIAGGILAGVISDRLEKRASTCGLMLLLAAPTVSRDRKSVV